MSRTPIIQVFFIVLLAGVLVFAEPPQAVVVNWQGINYPAHIISIEGGRYRIRYDEHREGRPDEETVGAERLKNSDYTPFRTGGAGNTAASSRQTPEKAIAEMPKVLPAGTYTCAMFVTGSGLVNNGEFIVRPDGSYERGGARGKFTYLPATGRVTFQGGPMDGRAAQYEARQVPTLHLKGNSRQVLAAGEERTVASCERK